jgi:hypothetical protein
LYRSTRAVLAGIVEAGEENRLTMRVAGRAIITIATIRAIGPGATSTASSLIQLFAVDT